jgi:hypothetical protein
MVTVVTEDGEVGEPFLSRALLVTPTQPASPNAAPRMAQTNALVVRTRAVSSRDRLVLVFTLSFSASCSL